MQLLEGLGIGGYRSFRDLVRIGPLAKVNLFVGGNNTGKSNILRFLHEHYLNVSMAVNQNREFALSEPIDRPLGHEAPFRFSRGFTPGHPVDFAELAPKGHGVDPARIRALLAQPALQPQGELVWIDYVLDGTGAAKANLNLDLPPHETLSSQGKSWYDWSTLLTLGRDHDTAGDVKRVYRKIIPRLAPLRPHLVPAIRSVIDAEPIPTDFSGAGLVKRLAQLRDPVFGKEADMRRFAAITSFVRHVVGNQSAQLDI